MSQHDYTIANQSFPNTRSDLNNSLSAIVSNNSGATEPTTTYAYQWWYDETTDILKMRNADNDAWITMFTFDQTADTYSLATDVELTITENLDLTGSATISGDLTVDTTSLKVDTATGRVGVGTANPDSLFHVYASTTNVVARFESGDADVQILLKDSGTVNGNYIGAENDNIYFQTNGFNEAMRIDDAQHVGIATTVINGTRVFQVLETAGTTGSSNESGFNITTNGSINSSTSGTQQMQMNDSSPSAGTHNYFIFRYQGTSIGDIDTIDNTTIRYNTFTGGHWSQFHDGTNPELKKGTVMSLTGDKLEYSKCEKTVIDEKGTEEVQKFEIAGTHEIGSEVTVPNDEYGEENSTTTATVVSNYNADHLVKVKVSDSVADKGVYGVWAGKYNDGDLSVEALGTSTIRIKQGEVLEVGDLLESAGDGTAQKQSDGIIKNSTIAKVTSPTPIETFDDNSFLVSCVLYCG